MMMHAHATLTCRLCSAPASKSGFDSCDHEMSIFALCCIARWSVVRYREIFDLLVVHCSDAALSISTPPPNTHIQNKQRTSFARQCPEKRSNIYCVSGLPKLQGCSPTHWRHDQEGTTLKSQSSTQRVPCSATAFVTLSHKPTPSKSLPVHVASENMSAIKTVVVLGPDSEENDALIGELISKVTQCERKL